MNVRDGLAEKQSAAATRLRHVAPWAMLSLVLTGCGLFDSGELWSSGPYTIVWIDAPDQAHLAYRVGPATTMGISDPCVSAVADNADYLAIEQRLQQSSGQPMYVVYAKKAPGLHGSPAVALGAPMRHAAYAALALRLGLPALRPVGADGACERKS